MSNTLELKGPERLGIDFDRDFDRDGGRDFDRDFDRDCDQFRS